MTGQLHLESTACTGEGKASVRDAIILADSDSGMIVDASPAAESLCGRSIAELRSLHYTQLHPPETAAPADDSALREVLHKDGRRIPVEVSSSHFTIPGGRRILVSVLRETTQGSAAREALRRSEERFRQVAESAGEFIWEVDADGLYLYASPVVEHILGYTSDEIVGKLHFYDLFVPETREEMKKAAFEVMARQEPFRALLNWNVRKDGGIVALETSGVPVRDASGKFVGYRGADADVTERKQAEAALRESEKRLKNAERLAHVGNWRWDIEAKRVFWSEELYCILGIPQTSTPGYKRLIHMVVPPDRVRVARWVRDCLLGKAENSLEFQISRPNGDLRTVTCVIEVSLDERGSPAHVSGTCQDITDFRRAQEEAFARQKLESVGTLAGGIAHDFNNLLGGVLANAELALGELAAGAHPEEELQRIRDMALQGREIVRQLMIYAGKESEIVELVDVSRLVREMVNLLRLSVSKNAVLETDLGTDLPPVRAKSAQLRRIVMNLVTNASEAIADRNGVIRVTTGRVLVGRAAAVSEGVAEGEYLQLEISDNGIGMPLEDQARAFDPFFTTKSVGRGLGLAVVRGIVRNLRGAIHFSSAPGMGTAFQILLPCAEAGAGAAAGPTSRAAEAASPFEEATILIVEDEDALRRAVAKMLRKTGFKILEAADGTAAIDFLRANGEKIDVILLDMTIPGCSSQEVVAEASQARPGSRVLLTSAYSEEMARATMSAPLVRGFIRKPFEIGELVQKLRNVLAP